jgi:hypothetical protein
MISAVLVLLLATCVKADEPCPPGLPSPVDNCVPVSLPTPPPAPRGLFPFDAKLLSSDPTYLKQFNIFVAHSETTGAQIEQLRHLLSPKNITVLMYSDYSWVYLRKGCSKCCGSGAVECKAKCDALEAVFNASWAVTNLHTNTPVCPFGEGHAVAAFIPNAESAPIMAQYIASQAVDFDGVYVDDLVHEFSPTFMANIENITGNYYDIDGDGVRDTRRDVAAQFTAWQPVYLSLLRQHLGDNHVIIGNTGQPSTPHPALNGISIELEWCNEVAPSNTSRVHECQETLAASVAQAALSGRPALNIVWLTKSRTAGQCAARDALLLALPGVVSGVDVGGGAWSPCAPTPSPPSPTPSPPSPTPSPPPPPSPYPTDGGVEAARALAVRVLGGEAARLFSFSVLPMSQCDAAARGGCAVITTSSANNTKTVAISGTSPVESAAALAHYCRKYLKMQFAWGKSGGNQVSMPVTGIVTLSSPIKLQRRCAASQPRCYSYFMNVCTASYSVRVGRGR